MPFVKLDCGILNSTLWLDRECRDIFITALLMAEPIEFHEPMPQIEIRSLALTGWCVDPGWYGFVPAAGVGIAHRAGVTRDVALLALEKLGNPESDSRTSDFEGRRLVRISGGYVVLNFMRYRERDYTCAERAKRYRLRKAAEKQQAEASHRDVTQSHRNVTQAEAEAYNEIHLLPSEEIESPERKNQNARSARGGSAKFEEFWAALPKENRIAKGRTRESWHKALRNGATVEQIINGVASYARYEKKRKHQGDYKPLHPSTWLNQGRFDDDCVITDQTNGNHDESWLRSVYG